MITYAEIIYPALILLLLAIKTGNACRISEFSCRGGSLCVPLDKYCDGKDDCGDSSDEPKFCTDPEAPIPDIRIKGEQLKTCKKFKYLGSMVNREATCDDDIKHRVSVGWMKWRENSGVFCDKNMPRKLKGKLYKTVVRPALLYASECWTMYKTYESKITATEMKMLRMTAGMTKKDRIKSSFIRGSLFVEQPITEKLEDRRMDWYCHVQRRPPENPAKKAISMDVPLAGPKSRGSRKHTWIDQMKKQQQRIGLGDDMIQYRAACRRNLRLYRQNGRSANTTVCNRTYYGDVGRTYTIKVPTPQWNRLPFLCHLTFTASGHDQGDIVQIIFDGFTVGRFDEGLVDSDIDGIESNFSPSGELPGCPEGFMQLSELGRPFTGGSWCGKATGPQLYFSETSTVTASVKVFHAPPQQEENPFEFRIRYKFISQSDAVVRYGVHDELLELGRVTPGTYCTRQFDECYRKKCRLQSPNYPGMYPRNVTCYWTIRQKTVPTCKHAMVSVSQDNQHKALVKRSIASLNKTSRSIRAWADCTGERDHLIFYDGSSTNDPVLAKYCGGDWLPRVVSRGPEMLIAFHSSPFSAPLQSGIPNRGFELDVDILFADSDSSDFAQGSKNLCEFHINASNPDDVLLSRRGRMGRIVSPRHTLPPNTTCTYYFHGYPRDLIWLSFTSFNLQILQQAIHDNNTLGRADLPPWIIRLRMWDSYGSYIPVKSTTTTVVPPSTSGTGRSASGNILGGGVSASINNAINNTGSYGNYYYSAQNPKYGKAIQVNIDNAWNPVDTYVYGPTQPSIYNQENKYGGYLSQKFGNGISSVRESFNYIAGERFDKNSKDSGPQSRDGQKGGGGAMGISGKHKRRLMLEIYDYETPKLCDHTAITSMTGHKLRPCSPLESYVSSGRDLKLEFHTHTGTALFPAQFALNYEFVDTELGGLPWIGRHRDDPVPPLCSRLFRRKGNVQAPRNVFLYGRGGAKNLTCLYRFEAQVNQRVQLVLHNVSFGDGTGCTTDTDLHTGRPKCSYADPESRIAELKIYDVPFKDVRIPLGCFCDNTTALYNAPVTFLSNSRVLELTFTVTRLNITEDFADVYFYASYECKDFDECRKKTRLKGAGGEDEIKYPLSSEESSCEGNSWYLEAQHMERSLFVQTWGAYLPIEPTSEDSMRCTTKNRLMIYSGQPLKVMRVICPSQPGPRPSSLHIFSEDWMTGHGMVFNNKPVNMVLEPIFKEPGMISFTWLEIQRTKASLIQQLDLQTNFTANETLGVFGLYPRDADCEYKCPELDACISELLWCDGHRNCPSGFDESEEECGTARKLLELPGGIFAALGCIAAAIAACLIFCIFGLMRKRRKSVVQKTVLNGTLSKKDIKKDPLFIDPGS